MKLSKGTIVLFAIVLLIFALIIYALPVVNKVRADMKAYETRVAYRDDYKLHTTPLSKEVVAQLCSELIMNVSSEICKQGAVVYAPDFFDKIKTYFSDLPNESKNYNTVEDVLGVYLTYCEPPYPDGSYVCHYDIRGDKVYPIAFFFDKDGFYYRIIASTGGS